MFLHPRRPSTIGNPSHWAGMEWWLQRMFDVSSESRSLAAGGLSFSRNRCIQVQFSWRDIRLPRQYLSFIPSILLVSLATGTPYSPFQLTRGHSSPTLNLSRPFLLLLRVGRLASLPSRYLSFSFPTISLYLHSFTLPYGL
ncbi:hypothetical protein BJX96DRAFT_12221 [Aspergillus floccosus]